MGMGGLQKLLNPSAGADNYGKSDAQKAKDAVQYKKDIAFKKELFDRASKLRDNQGPQFRQPPQQYAPTQQAPSQQQAYQAQMMARQQQQLGAMGQPGQPAQTPNFGRNAGMMPQGLHRSVRGNPQGGLIGGGQ